MKHIALKTLVAATVCLTTPAMAKTQQLTESMVREMMNKTEALVKSHNIDSFATYFSDDAKIDMTISMQGQSMPVSLTKQEYISELKKSMKQASNYSYSIQVHGISVSGDTAYVNSTVTENMTLSGVPMTSKASEKSTIKLIDGTPKITGITANGVITIKQ